MQLIERHSGSQSCSQLFNELMVMNLFHITEDNCGKMDQTLGHIMLDFKMITQ